MKHVMKNLFLAVFYVLPFLLGLYGFTKEFGEFSLAVIYSTLRLYTFNMDTPSLTGISIELWIAGFLVYQGKEQLRVEQLTELHIGVETLNSWEQLDNFTRRSNEAASEFIEVTDKILLECNHHDLRNLANQIARLEHERWCRFHWINNWSYTNMENQKVNKDKLLRLHHNLRVFDEMEQEIQDFLIEAAYEEIPIRLSETQS